MTRSRQREHAFLMLFRTEFHDNCDLEEQDKLYMDELESITDEDNANISSKVRAVRDKLEEIDSMISEKATGWNIGRIGKVELTILRLAVYELLFDDEIPTGVAINEAVELAKKFGGEDSFAFVNGVLSKFAN